MTINMETCKTCGSRDNVFRGKCAGCMANESMERALEKKMLQKPTVGLTITDLVNQAHETAKEKGWWDKEPTFGELIALCHSELSEALEAYRNGLEISKTYEFLEMYSTSLEGIPIELADVIIRIADMCGYYGIDLESAIKQKMEYNKSRPYRHGGKVI